MASLSAPDRTEAPAVLADGVNSVLTVTRPERQTLPVVFASPHSGNAYPESFLSAARLDPVTLRRSEDSFVDEIVAGAPAHGAPLIKALFPRAYLDPNREPFELDPEMFADSLPDYVNTRSPRVAAGLGTIAKVVANGEIIYRDKLSFQDAADRIERLYRPYHRTLATLLEETRAAFGWCLLIDCHSMPSVGGPMDQDSGHSRVDFVLGDCFGTSCDGAVTDYVETQLSSGGFTVTRNTPYSGGYTTLHYGRPQRGMHALQIEMNRALYMDERNYTRKAGLADLTACMERLIASLPALCERLAPGA